MKPPARWVLAEPADREALLLLGGQVLRDFSLTLLVGILVGTYSSIYVVAAIVVAYENWMAKRRADKVTPSKAS